MTLKVKKLTILKHNRCLFRPISFQVSRAEVLCIMGCSGIGKSSLLAGLNGELQPPLTMDGEALLDNQSIVDVPFGRRCIGLLHQQELLFPHFNVAQNLAFAVAPHYGSKERQQKVLQALQIAQLEDFSTANVARLSGGQYARIALMRTILAEPKVLLLDEPFANLDQQLKVSFRQWLKQLIKQQQIPMIIVSHDASDAITQNVLELQPIEAH